MNFHRLDNRILQNISVAMEQYRTAYNEAVKAWTSKYDVEQEVISDLISLLDESGKNHVKNPVLIGAVAASASTSASKGASRRKTGYNMYIKAKFSKAKEDGDDRDSQTQMKQYSGEWKHLSDEEKKPYEDLAQEANVGLPTEKPKKTGSHKMSGYNLYYKENVVTLREEAKTHDVKLMSYVGQKWKSLTDEERESYKTRAGELSAAASSD